MKTAKIHIRRSSDGKLQPTTFFTEEYLILKSRQLYEKAMRMPKRYRELLERKAVNKIIIDDAKKGRWDREKRILHTNP